MTDFFKEFQILLTNKLFKAILNADIIKLNELFAIQALLVKARIPYDLQFSSGTRREAAAFDLTIYINPTTTINFVINLEPGETIFSGFFPG